MTTVLATLLCVIIRSLWTPAECWHCRAHRVRDAARAVEQVGTVVKLVRVLVLGPVVLLMLPITSKFRNDTDKSASVVTAGDRPERGRPALHELVPWFIVGFLVVAILRTFDLIPALS